MSKSSVYKGTPKTKQWPCQFVVGKRKGKKVLCGVMSPNRILCPTHHHQVSRSVGNFDNRES